MANRSTKCPDWPNHQVQNVNWTSNFPDWPDQHIRYGQSVHQMSRLTEPLSSKCQLNIKLARLAGPTHPIWLIGPPNVQIDRTTKFKMSTEHQTYSIDRTTTSDMTNWSTKLTLNGRINQSNKPHGSSFYPINQTFHSDMVNWSPYSYNCLPNFQLGKPNWFLLHLIGWAFEP